MNYEVYLNHKERKREKVKGKKAKRKSTTNTRLRGHKFSRKCTNLFNRLLRISINPASKLLLLSVAPSW